LLKKRVRKRNQDITTKRIREAIIISSKTSKSIVKSYFHAPVKASNQGSFQCCE
jgi:hypothetical protein